jgi:sec-independent protein translocase protein TatB
MFDIGWPELLVVAIVLIVVVGPKDLPPMLRAFGRTTKKLRGMASEFRGQFDEALREAELDDVKKTFDDARKLNPMQSIRDAVNPLKDTARDIKADLEKSVNSPSSAEKQPAKMAAPEPSMKLSDGPPEVEAPAKAAASPAQPDAKPKATRKRQVKPNLPRRLPPQRRQQPRLLPRPNLLLPRHRRSRLPARRLPRNPALKQRRRVPRRNRPPKPATPKSAPRARKPKQGEGSRRDRRY